MYFRCSDCLSATWIERDRPLAAADSVRCDDCGKTYTANPSPEIGSTLSGHYQHALEFSNTHRVDMPTAYSILLGLMELEEMKILRGLESAVDRVADATERPEGPGTHPPELDEDELRLLDNLEAQDDQLDEAQERAVVHFQSKATSFDDELQQLLDNIEEEEPELDSEELALLDRLRAEESELDAEEIALLDAFGPTEGAVAPQPNDTSASAPEPAGRVLAEFDPGFQKAVARGRLTIEEAVRRGDRGAYASALARRHGFPMSLALAVADNRVTLYRARVHQASVRERNRPKKKTKARSITSAQRVSVFVIAAVAILMIGWDIKSRNFVRARPSSSPRSALGATRQAPPGPEPAPSLERHTGVGQESMLASTSVVTDESGRATEIAGPYPGTVLIAFCRAQGESAFFEPLEITETVPASGSARLGTFRDLDSLETPFAIRIRRDRKTRRWIAGDGKNPIPVSPAPELPPGARRLPIDPQQSPSR